jgi:hypothetical protein
MAIYAAGALSQLLCIGGAVVREGPGSEGAGSDAIGAALLVHAVGGPGALPRVWELVDHRVSESCGSCRMSALGLEERD